MSDVATPGLAQRLANAQAMLMKDIRKDADYLRDNFNYSLETFAELTGLHRNSALKLRDESWAPGSDTMIKLEIIITEASRRRQGLPGLVEPPPRGRPRARGNEGGSPSRSEAPPVVAKAS